MSKIENTVNSVLLKFPALKKAVKRVYQLGMYAISPKIRSEGAIRRVTPEDGYEYFFGYYDKSPWDASGRYMLCLRVKDTTVSPAPADPADIVVIDTHNGNSVESIAQTRTWNVQQGCMLQWLGPDNSTRIIYNDFRDGKYCSVIREMTTGEETVRDMPVYSVSSDGSFALTLDFSRLHRLRKGYGYSNLPEKTAIDKLPETTCIWKIDLVSNFILPIFSYSDFAGFEPRDDMKGAEHKVNHIMLSPDGKRFMVLHRWFRGSRKYTRLVTADTVGSDMFNLSDDDMVSHCCWRNDSEILAFAHKREIGNGYYLMEDRSNELRRMWPQLISDGHPGYSPDGSLVVTDTYPDRSRVASVYVMKGDEVRRAARVYAPFKYDNDLRCDLHPRWDRAGDKICIDSVFEGKRGLYVVDFDR